MLSITPIYGGLLVALLIVLAYRVTTFRRSEAVGLGCEGVSDDMLRAVRVHANAMENIPAALLLLLMLEINHLNPVFLHVLGAVLLVARILHAHGMSKANGHSTGRFYGTVLTWLTMLIMVVLNILIVVTR